MNLICQARALWVAGCLAQLFLFIPLEALIARDTAEAGVVFDLQGCIDQQVRAGKMLVVVPPGRYRVAPTNQQHLVLSNLTGVRIVADGVEMICTETTRALTITHCTNLALVGLMIDYDPLPFTQGRLTGFAEDKKIHEIEIFEGYPPAEAARPFKYEIFRPDTRRLRGEDCYPRKIEVVDRKHLRVILERASGADPEQAGDLVVMGAEYAPHGSLPHAVECDDSSNVRFDRVELFASNCFGFLESNCVGNTYFRCRAEPRAGASDLITRADPRLRSLNADAFHSKNAIRGPAYLECIARFMGDDGVNICADYHMIMASEGRELRVLAKDTLKIEPGDALELVAYDGTRLPDAKAVSIAAAGSIRDEERAFLSDQRLDAELKTARSHLTGAFTLTLDREVHLPRGSLLCSTSHLGRGFKVRGCTFGYNRSRGILIKASGGEVSNNWLEECGMSAILVSPEYWWLEAGSSGDVTIWNNTILACKGTPLSVTAMGGNGQVAPAGVHKNIMIVGNTIIGGTKPNIQVTSTENLLVEKNIFQSPKPGKSAEPDLVTTVNCNEINLRDNETQPGGKGG